MKKIKYSEQENISADILSRAQSDGGTKDHRTMVIWAAKCAQHVLFCFEENSPQDHRPRKAIQAGIAWSCGELKMSQARHAAFAAHTAARETADESAKNAARAAGHAAATAHVPTHAVHAVTYAAIAKAYASGSGFEQEALCAERAWQEQCLCEL